MAAAIAKSHRIHDNARPLNALFIRRRPGCSAVTKLTHSEPARFDTPIEHGSRILWRKESGIMKRILMTVLMVGGAGLFEVLPAQVTTTAVPFLMISPNSRAGGMGDAGVAVGDDAWASFWNPAGYAFQVGSEVGLDYSAWQPSLNLGDVWIIHSVYKQSVKELDGTVSAAFTYLNQGEIAHTENDATVLETFKSYDLSFAVGYARKLSDVIGIGMNVRLIRSVLAPFGPGGTGNGAATGFSFDIGMLYKPKTLFIPFIPRNFGERLRLGVNLSNMGPKMAYVDKALADPLPMNLRLGFAFRSLTTREHNITFVADFNKILVKRRKTGSDEFLAAMFTTWSGKTIGEQIRSFVTGMGIEYWYGSPGLLALRAGYYYEDPRNGNRKYFTFGAGVRVDSYGADFNYIAASEKDHPLGGTVRFSLLTSWGSSGE